MTFLQMKREYLPPTWMLYSSKAQVFFITCVFGALSMNFFTIQVTATTDPSSLLTSFVPLNPPTHKTRGKEAIFPPKADITLGGLFPVHHKKNNVFGQTCGGIDKERGIHRLEAMLFAITQVNGDPSLLPNITLGAKALDTCGQDTIALEESLEFVTEALISRNPMKCVESDISSRNSSRMIVGVIGAASSTISIQVANLLRLFKLPQVSYASTSPDLSNKHKYDYFVRTVPPDTHQARVMIDVISALNWSSVFTVRSYGNYAERGMEAFLNLAKQRDLCVVSSSRIPENAGLDEFDKIVKELLKEEQTKGVVVFCSDNDVKQLLAATARAKAAGKFSWVGSDYWGTRRSPVENHLKEAEGAITVSLKSFHIPTFRDYFIQLDPSEHSKVNPWFKEFWEDQFQCSFHSNSTTCHNKSLSRDINIDDKVPFVIDAVYSFAHALHQMYAQLCPKMNGVCNAMKKELLGAKLLQYLRNVSFPGVSGRIHFDDHGDSPGRYDIFRFIIGDYVQVASWEDGSLRLNNNWKYSNLVDSFCGEPCGLGYYRQLTTDRTCCWTCQPCGTNEYVQDGDKCVFCPKGETPTDNRTSCRPLELRYLDESWRIAITCFAGLGIVSTALVITIFIKFSNTPVVKASGRELTFTLLFGVLLCYGVGISLVLHPSVPVCFIQRFGIGFCVCMCYSALLIKTNRIARIFAKSERSTKPPGLISPGSQLLILAAFVSVEIIFAGIGIGKWPPKPTRMYPTKSDVLLTCNIQNYDLIIAMSYNILLIILCTFYAFKTRKTPANFNEARYIGFAMYTTCVIWLTFLPVQYGFNDKDYKVLTLSINITLNATTLLLCVFGPKVYIVVLRPTRNIRSRSLTTWKLEQNGIHFKTGRMKSDSESTQCNEVGVDNPVPVTPSNQVTVPVTPSNQVTVPVNPSNQVTGRAHFHISSL